MRLESSLNIFHFTLSLASGSFFYASDLIMISTIRILINHSG